MDALAASEAPAVVVTAARQFPTGAVLARERRAALVEWAESEERLIIEDDYDGEYRYDRGALGALQGLAPERTVYIGSASKRLFPGMRLGWLLTPSWLAWQLISAKAVEDAGSEVIGQLALGDFIARGELDRHVRRMRINYQQRRDVLLGALARWLPEATHGDDPAGLHELVEPALRRQRDSAREGRGRARRRHRPPLRASLRIGGTAGRVARLRQPLSTGRGAGVRLLGEAFAEVRGTAG